MDSDSDHEDEAEAEEDEDEVGKVTATPLAQDLTLETTESKEKVEKTGMQDDSEVQFFKVQVQKIPEEEENVIDNTKVATRSSDGSYAMIYFPSGGSASLNLLELSSKELTSWWYDPRTGNSFPGEKIEKSDKITVTAPTTGKGHDWVLVLDSPALKVDAPGKTVYKKG